MLRIFAVVLFGVFLQTLSTVQGAPSNFCNSQPNGNYPDPDNCHGYTACSNHIRYNMPCPAELMWNDRQKICDWPQNAYPSCGASSNPYSYSCQAHVGSHGFCRGRINGNYPDSSNCHGYIACSNGLTYHMPCPASLKWNDRRKVCDWPRHAFPACSGGTSSPSTTTSSGGISGGSYCHGKTNGDYPDSSNCHGFISCSNGITYHMPCPAGLKWNDNQKRCDWPQYANPGCSGVSKKPTYVCRCPNGNSHSNFCSRRSNGNYPDSPNCNGYISCSNGITYRMPCPAGLVWNDASKICDWRRNVVGPCGTKVVPTTSSGSFSCSGKTNGNYRNPSNCHGFITCSNGIAHQMACPAGLVWNDDVNPKICDWKHNVPPPCGTKVVPTTSQNNFCTGKSNGNYPDPNNDCNYITCSNGVYTHQKCPGNLKWNGVKRMCDWHSGDKHCKRKGNGNYPDPGNCYGYIACSNHITYHMPCPAGLMWNSRKKLCDWPQYATENGCRAGGCTNLLSDGCCDIIRARSDCGGVVGLYCRKKCNRC